MTTKICPTCKGNGTTDRHPCTATFTTKTVECHWCKGTGKRSEMESCDCPHCEGCKTGPLKPCGGCAGTGKQTTILLASPCWFKGKCYSNSAGNYHPLDKPETCRDCRGKGVVADNKADFAKTRQIHYVRK